MAAGLLHLHNLLRLVIVVAGIVTVVRAFMGVSSGKPYNKTPATVFLASLHVQVILGLIIYFGVSGVAAAFRADPGGSMKIAMLRFFGMEHLLLMLAAVVVATIGSARTRRAQGDVAKHKTARLFFTVAMLLLVAGIPWPFRGDGVGRPLFPGMSSSATVSAPVTEANSPPAPATSAP
ncbi:MAG TPA: hypothetical protein VGF99_03875 [Myxococcota bacterium]